jgi:hypothetical protein
VRLLHPCLRATAVTGSAPTSVLSSEQVSGASSAHILMVVSREPVMMPISPTAMLRTCLWHGSEGEHVGSRAGGAAA